MARRAMRSRGAIPSTRIFRSGVAVPKSTVAHAKAMIDFGSFLVCMPSMDIREFRRTGGARLLFSYF
jgi:hypothetical protein